jgi:hypothetical protein
MFAVALLAACASAAERKELRYEVAPGASVSIYNPSGSVVVRPSSGSQIIVAATADPAKVQLDNSQNGNRIEVRSHPAKGAAGPARVDYDIQVPPAASVAIRTSDASIRAERLKGDLSAESDAGPVEVRDLSGGHLRVRTVSGPVTVNNLSNAYLEVTSVGGKVSLNNVSGRKVSVNTTTGPIRYEGNFSGVGDYSLTNHSGDIDVILPASSSVEISARSVTGSVQNDFPFQPKTRTSYLGDPARALAGTANAGGASVKLRTFSGKIRVHKQ